MAVQSLCGLGGVLWIPVQVEQCYGLAENRFILKPEHRFLCREALILKNTQTVNLTLLSLQYRS